jgi:hypothetical protein
MFIVVINTVNCMEYIIIVSWDYEEQSFYWAPIEI